MRFIDRLKDSTYNGGVIFFDGGMGSMLQAYGLPSGTPTDTQNILNRDAVIDIHRQYIEAGAEVLLTNTLGCHELNFANADELITAAVENVRAAIEKSTAANKRRIYIALDMGPTGRLLKPLGDLDFEECFESFKRFAECGARSGVDFILIETMTDIYELKAAVMAAKTTGLPVVATMSFNEHGRTLTGTDPAGMAIMLEALGVDALGMNCGYGPDLYERLLPSLINATALPVLVQPNAGLPIIENGKAVYSLSADGFADSMARIAEMRQNKNCSVLMLGGCCGTTPEHIALMTQTVRRVLPEINDSAPGGKKLVSNAEKQAAVSSASKYVLIDEDFNICDIPYCGSADLDDRIDEALDFADEAEIIKVRIDEPGEVQRIQEMVRIPLVLSSENPEALLGAVRLYNGVPLIEKTQYGAEFCEALRAAGAVVL